jgi:methionyl-tRNA formyltransferase
MRVVFMGSPAFSVPSLRAVQSSFDLVGVVTQPDRPAGRGRRVQQSEVKRAAVERSIPVLQPVRLKDPEALRQLQSWEPDVIVLAAFGQLVPPMILGLPGHGCVNVHPSLLPRWRGASPIQTAILQGEKETGVTIMKLDAGLDTGPIIAQRRVAIDPEITAGELDKQLAELGASLLVESLPDYLEGAAKPVPQDDDRATYAPAISKSAGQLDFTRPAADLVRQVRAFEPRPGSYLSWRDRRIIVRRAHRDAGGRARPGEVVVVDGQPAVATPDGRLVLDIIQPAGKGLMPGSSFVRGAPDFIGVSLLLPNTA